MVTGLDPSFHPKLNFPKSIMTPMAAPLTIV